jgi:hypothetical protein
MERKTQHEAGLLGRVSSIPICISVPIQSIGVASPLRCSGVRKLLLRSSIPANRIAAARKVPPTKMLIEPPMIEKVASEKKSLIALSGCLLTKDRKPNEVKPAASKTKTNPVKNCLNCHLMMLGCSWLLEVRLLANLFVEGRRCGADGSGTGGKSRSAVSRGNG